jgi:deoxyxylulose-5-phosphate synthase
VTGTDFTGDTDSVELLVNDVKQTTKSVTATEAVFTVVDVSSQSVNSNVLYFDVGIPENHTVIQ